MKKLIAAFSFLTIALCPAVRAERVDQDLLGMLRVVEDKDGFVNVRKTPSLQSAIVGKVTSGAAVSTMEKKGDFTSVSFDSANDGFIHTSRLKPLTGWKQVGAKVAGNKATAKFDTLAATVTASPFVAKEHKITKDREGIELVDGRTVWGVDGGIPNTSLRLSVTLNGTPIEVPAEATRDLFQPSLESLAILTPGQPEKQTLIFMMNSDGAGAYCVVWSFSGAKYVGRTVFVPF